MRFQKKHKIFWKALRRCETMYAEAVEKQQLWKEILNGGEEGRSGRYGVEEVSAQRSCR